MLAAPETLPDLRAEAPPVLLVHGDADTMIPVEALFAATVVLGRAGVLVQWHISAGVPHSIDPQGLSLGGGFLAMAVRGKLRRPPGDVCCALG
jgi:phospholipase/carboxylesterase